MMTKQKSKQIKQLKYLLLLPVLLTMFFYTACSEKGLEDVISKKELVTIYVKIGDNYERDYKGKKETYLDFYQGTQEPNWDEITFNDLSSKEKLEYQESKKILEVESAKESGVFETKLYEKPDGRRVIASIINFSNIKKEKTNKNEVPFSIIDKVPTYPGCAEGDKECFSKNIQRFFAQNFDADLPKTLKLSPGKKRIIILFKIDKEGNVTNVKAKAPHPKLEDECVRIIESLPKMLPGEQEGKAVTVKYTLPMRIDVE